MRKVQLYGGSGVGKTEMLHYLGQHPAQFFGPETVAVFSVGDMYRALAHTALTNGAEPTNNDIFKLTKKHELALVDDRGILRPAVDGRVFSPTALMSPQVSDIVAHYATKTAAKDVVRRLKIESLRELQAMGTDLVIMDSRGGEEHADQKGAQQVQIVAPFNQRVNHRFAQLQSLGYMVTPEQVADSLIQREDQDRHSGIMVPPPNALVLERRDGLIQLAKDFSSLINKDHHRVWRLGR